MMMSFLFISEIIQGQYLCNIRRGKSIYTVSSQVIEDLNYTEEDLIQLDDYPSIGSGNLEKAVITQNKNSVVYDSADETQTEQIIAIAGAWSCAAVHNGRLLCRRKRIIRIRFG